LTPFWEYAIIKKIVLTVVLNCGLRITGDYHSKSRDSHTLRDAELQDGRTERPRDII